MVIKQIIGTLKNVDEDNLTIDWLPLEWYETGKRILHKKTVSGKEVVLKLLNNPQPLQQNDVVYKDEERLIVIDIKPCTTIIIRPETMYQMASVVYEIGNKHLPLFYEADTLLVPFEQPLFHLLKAAGFAPEKSERKLLYPLKTSVAPHGHGGGESLFSKILKLTTPANE